MKSHFSLLFLAVLLLTACKNNPNELIVGKWTCVDVQADFPALEELNPDSLTEQESLIMAASGSLWKSLKGSALHFTEDGTFSSFQSNKDKAEAMGKFLITDNGKKLISNYANQEYSDSVEIVTLSSDSLITLSSGDGVSIRLSYAREK